MVAIVDARFVAGNAAYFFDDQAAIKQGAPQDGFVYRGSPVTPGYEAVRQPGESISVMLLLDTGQWAVGDCCAVQYSGAGGRDPLFTAHHYVPFLENQVAPLLIGLDATSFLHNAGLIDGLMDGERQAHTAVRYGVSQALLDAAALALSVSKTEVICRCYDLPLPDAAVPLFAQSGDDRYSSVDKMLMRRVDALPHALINSVDGKLGRQGEALLEYVRWLVARIRSVKPLISDAGSYHPTIHIDVYGTVGLIFDNQPRRVGEYLCRLAEAAEEFELYIEGPVDVGDHQRQIACLGQIREYVDEHTESLKIVADEWCNTLTDIRHFVDAKCCHMAQIKTPDLGSIHNVVEAVLYCKDGGVEAYQGGSCNETDLSARCCTQVALACQPDRLLIKPGMGFDEGMQIVSNEMNRTLEQLAVSESNDNT